MAYASSGAQANMWNAAPMNANNPGAAAAAPAPAMPYIGAKISLISSAGIRYEGALANVDPENSTIGLHNVRTYGTEGRKAEHEILPSDDIYDYIVFRGKDILDLTVQEPVPTPPDDPAILMCSTLPSPSHNAAQAHHYHQGAAVQPSLRPPPTMTQGGGAGAPVDYHTAVNMMNAYAANHVVQQHHQGVGPLGTRQLPTPIHPSIAQQQQQQAQQQHNANLFRMYQAPAMPQYPTPPPSMRYDHQYLSSTNRRGGLGRGTRGGGYGGGFKRVTGELTPRVNESLKSLLEPSFNFEEWNRKFEKYPVHRAGQKPAAAQASPPTPPTETSAKTAATATTEAAPDVESASPVVDKSEDDKQEAAKTSGGEREEGDNSKSVTARAQQLSPPSNPVYDKGKSFFDNISCEALDRRAGYEVRVDRSRQRQLDVETFGPSAANPIRRGGRGYRRGGVGGYSRAIGSIYGRGGGGLLGPMIHTGGYPSYPC